MVVQRHHGGDRGAQRRGAGADGIVELRHERDGGSHRRHGLARHDLSLGRSAGTDAPNTGPSVKGAPGVEQPGTSSSGSSGATQGSGTGKSTTGLGTTGAGVDVPRPRPGDTSR